MTIFDHPIYKHIRIYFHLVEGRDNIDVLQLPDDLRRLALNVVCNCVACGAPMHPFRVRAKSERARVKDTPDERRLFYAGTCPSEVNRGCSRTLAAREHKDLCQRILRKVMNP